MSNEPFLGLTMPVFNAFGWAGEDTALAFALDQLEQFVQQLHASMSREAQTIFPHRGLNRENQGVYLANNLETAKGLYITYHARPMALRMGISLHERMALSKALSAIQANHTEWHDAIQKLGDAWEIRFQQMEYNPETGEAVHYKDLFKDRATALELGDSAELIDRLIYLNSEEKWLGPIELSKRMNSEFVAAMGGGVVDQMAKDIAEMMPILRLLNGGIKISKRKPSSSKKVTKARPRAKQTSASTMASEEVESFSYVTTLKPLHIRKGFVNMTEAHWPYFKINSRTETRAVILKFDGNVDNDCTVWRLMPAEKARLVLSDRVHDWLSDNFSAEDEIQIFAKKLPEKKIEIELALVR